MRDPIVLARSPSVAATMSSSDPSGPAVLCWDGSDGARRAIGHAARLLGEGHPAIVLFAHMPPESAKGMFAGRSAPDAAIMGTVDAEDLVDDGVRAARTAGLAASGARIVPDTRTSAAIAAVAEEHDARLIVMGQRRRSAVGTLVLGSVAREVLGAVHRPVLLVGPADGDG